MSCVVIWRYQVRPERLDQFLAAYGPEGEWARLFRRSADFLGVELLEDARRRNTFVTLDRWQTQDALLAFKRDYKLAYAELDKRCAAFTLEETQIGAHRSVQPSPAG